MNDTFGQAIRQAQATLATLDEFQRGILTPLVVTGLREMFDAEIDYKDCPRCDGAGFAAMDDCAHCEDGVLKCECGERFAEMWAGGCDNAAKELLLCLPCALLPAAKWEEQPEGCPKTFPEMRAIEKIAAKHAAVAS